MTTITAGPIKQIAYAVHDLEESVAFYRDTLGLALLFRAEPGLAFLECHGIRLMLSKAKEVSPGGPILYFAVEEIDKTYKALADAGANVIREPRLTHKTDKTELWLAFFKDPDGHTLGLMEEKALGA